jgi:DNA polymerase III delta prime subunit
MSLQIFKDKYKPKFFHEYQVNIDTIKYLKNLVNHKSVDNFLVYGPAGSGKYVLALSILTEIYGINIHNKKKVYFKVKSGNGNKEVEIISSQYHYEILLNSYIFNDKFTIINIIKEIVQNQSVLQDYKIILIKNCENISNDTFILLKTLVEMYSNSARFILTFSRGNFNDSKISGLFLKIRLPYPKNNELKNFIKYVCNQEFIKMEDEYVEELIKKTNKISKILLELEYFSIHKKLYENPFDKQLDIIIKLIEEKKVNNILKIRKNLYDILSCNINKISIFKKVVKYFVMSDYNLKIKNKIVGLAAEFTSNLESTYRLTILLESFLINIMNILISNE